MIDTCFVISSNENEKNCEKKVNEIKKYLKFDKVANLNIKTNDISIDTLLSLNIIDKTNSNIPKNDLNQLIVSKSENRALNLADIKEYIEHVQIWQYIAKGNEDIVLVLDNCTKIKNHLNCLTELNKSIEHLPDFYGLLGLCKVNTNSFNVKCNDYVNYIDIGSKIGHGYIITKEFACKLINYALPMKTTIHRLLSEIAIINKKGYQMKYPILELDTRKDYGNMLLSIPINNVNISDSNVYIFDEGEETYVFNINSVKKNWESVQHVSSEEIALTKIIISGKPGIVINSKYSISKKIFDNLTNEFPINMHFLGWTEKHIEEPFIFSNTLQYVHPLMPQFVCYYVTSFGANLLVQLFNSDKVNQINTILSRERIGFAHVVDKL